MYCRCLQISDCSSCAYQQAAKMELCEQLLIGGFPFGRARAVVVALALADNELTDLQDLRGIAHEIVQLENRCHITDLELEWLVEASYRLQKLDAQCVTISDKGTKRPAPNDINATTLHDVVANMMPAYSELNIAVCGPAKAAKQLNIQDHAVDRWLADARLEAIAGSCPRSRAEIRSAVKAYAAFALKMGKIALPPTTDLLLSWSCLFRCSGTYQNYVSSLRTACEMTSFSTAQMHHHLLKRAARAIDKRRGYIARAPMFIDAEMMRRILKGVGSVATPRVQDMAMACLTTYVFLLRMPSECLPITVAQGDASDAQRQAVVTVGEDAIRLRLKRRKNKESGSMLKRKCWCAECKLTCPVHVLGPYFAARGPGAMPFSQFDGASALAILRGWLGCLGIKQADQYRTHDIRRGHARDLQKRGATLCEILSAGEWRSAAFLSYLDRVELECGATMESHINESSDEECER